VWVSLQMWDTPGRERIAFKRRRQSHTYASAFNHDFFSQADAIMLVYDMTSSTSFTQLMKWYADLMELQNDEDPLPILIVANKLDLMQNDSEHEPHPRRRKVPQRDIMGLQGHFRGNDFQYEYQVSSSPTGNDFLWTSPMVSDRKKKELTKKMVRESRRMEISSFLVNRENWTDDWSYLASLLVSEDLSHPDRDMVLLWCMRNGLPHCEASASTGEGVSEAVGTMLRLALNSKQEPPQPKAPAIPMTRSRLDRLDLHQRYATEEESCCTTFVLRPFLRIVQKTSG
jgi:GTPase SAR1 family protein